MMLIECRTCPVREVRCADCMVTALNAIPTSRDAALAGDPADPPSGLPLDRAERRAVSVLLAAGLVTSEAAHAAQAVRDPAPARVRSGYRRAVG